MMVRKASAFTGIEFPASGPPTGTVIHALQTRWRSEPGAPAGFIRWRAADGRVAVTPLSFFNVAAFKFAKPGPVVEADPPPVASAVGTRVEDPETVAGWELRFVATRSGVPQYARWRAQRCFGTLTGPQGQTAPDIRTVWRHAKIGQSPVERPETEAPDMEAWGAGSTLEPKFVVDPEDHCCGREIRGWSFWIESVDKATGIVTWSASFEGGPERRVRSGLSVEPDVLVGRAMAARPSADTSERAYFLFLAECDPCDQPSYERWKAWELAGRPDWSEVEGD